MRVLQLLSSSGFHGAETMTAELVYQLHRLGAKVAVGVLDNSGRGDRKILEAAAPYIEEGLVIPCRGQLDLSPATALRKYIAGRQPDVIHSHKYKTTFYALLARRRKSCGLVVTYHNWLTDSLALRFYTALDKHLARFTDGAVGVSAAVTRELHRYAPGAKIQHIGNGIDPQRYHRVKPRDEAKRALGLPEQPLLGFVGRLSAQKGLSHLLRAIHALPAGLGQRTHLVIVGEGEYRSALVDETRALGLTARVHFLGTRSDTPLIYSALDAFVLPSLQEAFPMVVLEAMGCGAPVIATDIGDVAQIVEHDVSGFVVPPTDETALAHAIERLLTDRALADRFADVARERVSRAFSSIEMARAYLSLYERVRETVRNSAR